VFSIASETFFGVAFPAFILFMEYRHKYGTGWPYYVPMADDGREKPEYKRIARGRRKGKLVPKSWAELKAERQSRGLNKMYAQQEARRLQQVAQGVKIPRPITEGPKRFIHPDVVKAFAIVVTLSALSFGAAILIAKVFQKLHVVGLFIPIVLVDALAYLRFGKRKRYSRYLPFLWWL
jgi:hypothetical protein